AAFSPVDGVASWFVGGDAAAAPWPACSPACPPACSVECGIGACESVHGTSPRLASGSEDCGVRPNTYRGSPTPHSFVSRLNSLPQKADQGIPVTARNRIAAAAVMPVTACRSRHHVRCLGFPRTL